jgi:hypothetical protein
MLAPVTLTGKNTVSKGKRFAPVWNICESGGSYIFPCALDKLGLFFPVTGWIRTALLSGYRVHRCYICVNGVLARPMQKQPETSPVSALRPQTYLVRLPILSSDLLPAKSKQIYHSLATYASEPVTRS